MRERHPHFRPAQAAPPTVIIATTLAASSVLPAGAKTLIDSTERVIRLDDSDDISHRRHIALGGGVMGKVDGSANAQGGPVMGEVDGSANALRAKNGIIKTVLPAGGLGIAPIDLVAAAHPKHMANTAAASYNAAHPAQRV